MDLDFWLAVGIFVVSYLAISFESFHGTHKAVIALSGAALVMGFKILTQNEAFYSAEFGVDWNVVFLLIAMMIIVNIIKPTGFLEYLAITCAKLGRAKPYRIMAIFAVVTAFISAFIDNVTTVLLVAPVILVITDKLDVDPVPFFISIALASNIGGTATLIGDPPNIMIASRANLTFMDFIYHLTPVVAIILAVYILMLSRFFRKRLKVSFAVRKSIMEMKEKDALKDPALIKRALLVLFGMVLCFIFHDRINLPPATIALFGASVLLIFSEHARKPYVILENVEWASIFFFIGLFIIVGALVKVGFITIMAKVVIGFTKGNVFNTSIIMLWFSSIVSAIIDNIPFVATMNPLIVDMARQLWPSVSNPEIVHRTALLPVWWSLALGACLGGNGTIIGASANVVVAGMAEKAGKKISFTKFIAYAFPVWLMSIIVSTLYVWLRYFYFARPY